MNIKEKKLAHTEKAREHIAPIAVQQAHSAFSKLSALALLAAAIASGLLAITVGFPANTALLIVTGGLLIGAGLATIRFRWMSLFMTLVSGLFLYENLRAPFVLYHLTDPQGHGFFFFLMDVLIIGFTLIAVGASIGALGQNFLRKEWYPAVLPSIALNGLITGVLGMLIGAIFIGALAQPEPTGPVSTGATFTNTVHMNAASFTQPSVTIAKGSKLLLVDDVAEIHILANGSWQQGTAAAVREPGAPVVNNEQVNGGSVEVGPFTTAGTYHIYCTIHQGMDLTIVVQ